MSSVSNTEDKRVFDSNVDSNSAVARQPITYIDKQSNRGNAYRYTIKYVFVHTFGTEGRGFESLPVYQNLSKHPPL